MQASFAPSFTVVLQSAYRISPPVEVPTLEEVPNHRLPFEDMDLEDAVIDEAETTGERLGGLHELLGETNSNSDKDDDAALRCDRWEAAILKYTSKGLSREAAAVALAGVGDKEEVVERFANNFTQMEQLGFSQAQIAGALMMCNNDLDRAIATCCAD